MDEIENKPVETPPVETPEEKPTEQFDKLSNKEAIRKAIADVREKNNVEQKEPQQKAAETPSAKEIKQDLADDVEAPSGFTKEEKEAWKKKDIGQIQKAYRRLDNERRQELSRAHNEAFEAKKRVKTWEDLEPIAGPYIKAQEKQGVTFQQAVKNALELVAALQTSDPAKIKEEFKKAKIDLDAAPGQPNVDNSKIEALQNTVDTLVKDKEAQNFERLAQTFDTTFRKLGAEKNRAGDLVFPDFHDNSERGKQLATDIGTLTFDPKFQAGVLRRFPDADLTVVVREAYKYLGGKVQGETVRSSQDNQQEIERKKRASLSAPARQSARGDRSSLIGKLSNTAAIRQAIKDYREH